MIKLAADIRIEKYRIIRKLGEGGMGRAWKAFDRHLNKYVVIKTIVTPDDSLRNELRKEAEFLINVRHPNIVDVTDFGVASHRGEPLAYLVMEYLDGSSLADVLRQESNLPLAWCVDVIEQIGSAVDEAHPGRHPLSRPQARQHLARAESTWRLHRQGSRLRPREAVRRGA